MIASFLLSPPSLVCFHIIDIVQRPSTLSYLSDSVGDGLHIFGSQSMKKKKWALVQRLCSLQITEFIADIVFEETQD